MRKPLSQLLSLLLSLLLVSSLCSAVFAAREYPEDTGVEPA